ncbi:MAG TPA: glycosyltransferase [Pirellulales bacterium]|nr:glycosyltransferase [Pirellulales bacterium]
MTDPLVSVVIPCYNQAEFLPLAIDSVLAQSYGSIELVVVDDGSTDNTPAVLAAYAGRVKAVRQINAGLAAARNAGLAVATGELVAFLDSDDVLFPDTIERHVAALTSHPEASVSYGGCVSIDNAGIELERVTAKPLPDDAFASLLAANRFPVHAAMVRRAAADEVGNFDSALRACEDWDWWIRLAAAGHRFVSTNGAWVGYRRHPASMSASYSRMLEGGLQVMAKHAQLARRDRQTRWGLACGRRSIRYYAFQQALLPQLKEQLRAGRATAALKRLLAASFQDIASLRFFVVEYWCIRLLTLFHRTVEFEARSS